MMLLFIRLVSLILLILLVVGLIVTFVMLKRRADQPKKKKRVSEHEVRRLLLEDRYEDALVFYQEATDVDLEQAQLAINEIADALEVEQNLYQKK